MIHYPHRASSTPSGMGTSLYASSTRHERLQIPLDLRKPGNRRGTESTRRAHGSRDRTDSPRLLCLTAPFPLSLPTPLVLLLSYKGQGLCGCWAGALALSCVLHPIMAFPKLLCMLVLSFAHRPTNIYLAMPTIIKLIKKL